MSLSPRLCDVCNLSAAKYSCPRCNTPQCSLDCFKVHDGTCTESFYERQVNESLGAAGSDSSTVSARARALRAAASSSTSGNFDFLPLARELYDPMMGRTGGSPPHAFIVSGAAPNVLDDAAVLAAAFKDAISFSEKNESNGGNKRAIEKEGDIAFCATDNSNSSNSSSSSNSGGRNSSSNSSSSYRGTESIRISSDRLLEIGRLAFSRNEGESARGGRGRGTNAASAATSDAHLSSSGRVGLGQQDTMTALATEKAFASLSEEERKSFFQAAMSGSLSSPILQQYHPWWLAAEDGKSSSLGHNIYTNEGKIKDPSRGEALSAAQIGALGKSFLVPSSILSIVSDPSSSIEVGKRRSDASDYTLPLSASDLILEANSNAMKVLASLNVKTLKDHLASIEMDASRGERLASSSSREQQSLVEEKDGGGGGDGSVGDDEEEEERKALQLLLSEAAPPPLVPCIHSLLSLLDELDHECSRHTRASSDGGAMVAKFGKGKGAGEEAGAGKPTANPPATTLPSIASLLAAPRATVTSSKRATENSQSTLDQIPSPPPSPAPSPNLPFHIYQALFAYAHLHRLYGGDWTTQGGLTLEIAQLFLEIAPSMSPPPRRATGEENFLEAKHSAAALLIPAQLPGSSTVATTTAFAAPALTAALSAPAKSLTAALPTTLKEAMTQCHLATQAPLVRATTLPSTHSGDTLIGVRDVMALLSVRHFAVDAMLHTSLLFFEALQSLRCSQGRDLLLPSSAAPPPRAAKHLVESAREDLQRQAMQEKKISNLLLIAAKKARFFATYLADDVAFTEDMRTTLVVLISQSLTLP